MKKVEFLRAYIKTADIHGIWLELAINKTIAHFPLTGESLAKIPEVQVAMLDMLTTRFGKLQDIIGSKIIPIMLDLLGEDALSFRDKLNKLEKLKIIQDAQWWMRARELRNALTHDYPDDYELLARELNQLVPYGKELLSQWRMLKEKCAALNLDGL